jgi:glycosyltransferase involved in cell wall biosynthesis
LGCADAVIAVSDRLAEALRRAFPTLERGIRVYAVPNGVDTGFFTPGDEPRRPGSVLMAGTLSPSKDHATLLDAVALLAGKRPVELLLAGDGILRADLERRATDLRVQTHVRFLGTASRADLLRLYRQTAVFAFSTKGEGSPLAMLEAMACGLPVAASDVPGVREILEGGRRGLPVSPGDAAAMASAIERLLDDPESARRLGVAARQYVEVEHSASRMAARYGEILNAF